MTKREQENLLRLGDRLGRLGFVAQDVAELLQIERALRRSSEARCNYSESEEQEARRDKREARLERRAQALAENRSCRVYFQGDPRGCAVYVLKGLTENPERPDDSYYSSDGIAVCT